MKLPSLAETVRRADPDRFLTTLFAPAPHRPALWALYAFNHELARARETASTPALALIRLQWWREALLREERGPEPLGALKSLIRSGRLAWEDLDPLIEGRMKEAEGGFADVAAFLGVVDLTAGALAAAAARILGADETGRREARRVGRAYGIAGLLRALPFHAAQGRVLLPAATLSEAGLSEEEVIRAPQSEAVREVVRRLAGLGTAELAALPSLRRFPPSLRPLALLAVWARRDLAHLARRGTAERRPADRFAVIGAGLGLALWGG